MYFTLYMPFLIPLLLCAILGIWANAKVQSAYRAYGEMPNASHMTGYDTAKRLLKANGLTDISVGRVKGTLSDHYHPVKKKINLSEDIYGGDSIAAVAIAAHEVGHAVQKKKGYFPYKIRAVLVPITNFGTRLALPLVLVGLLLDVFVSINQNTDIGYYVAMAGVALYGLSTLFALVTLPVEFNASARAKKMLVEEGILSESELPYASKMLSAAAQTYVASLITSLVYFLRFAMWVLMLFGGRRRRN